MYTHMEKMLTAQTWGQSQSTFLQGQDNIVLGFLKMGWGAMGYFLFRTEWELWFWRSFCHLSLQFVFINLSLQCVFILFCRWLLHHKAETEFCSSALMFWTPPLPLPKPKLIKWSYILIMPFWNSLPRIILLVPACTISVQAISLQCFA